LGIVDWTQSPIPNPKSPNIFTIYYLLKLLLKIIIKNE